MQTKTNQKWKQAKRRAKKWVLLESFQNVNRRKDHQTLVLETKNAEGLKNFGDNC